MKAEMLFEIKNRKMAFKKKRGSRMLKIKIITYFIREYSRSKILIYKNPRNVISRFLLRMF